MNRSAVKGRQESTGKRLCLVRHDSEKLLLAYLAILVEVEFVYHRLSDSPTIRVSKHARGPTRKEGRRTTRRPRDDPRFLWRRVADCVSISYPCYHHRTTGTRAESPPSDLAPKSSPSLFPPKKKKIHPSSALFIFPAHTLPSSRAKKKGEGGIVNKLVFFFYATDFLKSF